MAPTVFDREIIVMRTKKSILVVCLVIKLRGAVCEARRTIVVYVFTKIDFVVKNRPIKGCYTLISGSAEINPALVDGLAVVSISLVGGLTEISPAPIDGVIKVNPPLVGRWPIPDNLSRRSQTQPGRLICGSQLHPGKWSS